jgi:very-short-patch-repair endonuclease
MTSKKKEQKEALLEVLKSVVDSPVETEKQFDWLIVPEKPTDEIQAIRDAIVKYRNENKFYKNYGCKLECDYFIEKYKMIIEFDERQHFTEQRRLALENYPADLKYGFALDTWIHLCSEIKAKMNKQADPDRDETRAYYDSLRDILAAKNGYTLIRIFEKDKDWTAPNAKKFLEEKLKIG